MHNQPLIYYCDFLTHQPSLCLFSRKRYQTIIGTIFSFMVIFTLFGFCVYFLNRFFSRIDINLVYMKDSSETAKLLNLSDSLFVLNAGNRKVDDSVLKVAVSHYYQNKTNSTFKFTEITLVKCNESLIPLDYRNSLTGDITRFLCLPPHSDIVIQEDNNIASYLVISLILCDEDYFDGCKSHSEVSKILSSLYSISFDLYIENDKVDHYNKTNPIQKQTSKISFSPSYGFYYDSTIFLEVLSYETDIGYVFEDIRKELGVYYNPAMTTTQGNLKDESDFGDYLINLTIEMYSLGSEQYSRSYRKIQNVIADMGGILSVIQTVSSVIVNIIASNLLFIQLSQNIIQNKAMFIRKSINEGVCNTSNSNKVNKTEDVFLASTVSNQKGYVMKKIKETPKKENIKHKTSLFKKIGVKDFILFLVGCSKSNGSNLIELSRRITLSSLSCDTLIKMNINQQKLIEYVGDKRKKKFVSLNA